MKIPITTGSGLDTALEKVGRSLSDRFGIRVVCRGNECATNGRTIFLPALPDEMPPEMLQVIRGYLDHESSHICGKSNFRILKWFRNTYGPTASLFLNMLEDLRVEEFMRQRFPGSGKNLAAAHAYLTEEALKDTEPMPVLRQLAFGVHARGNRLPDPLFVEPDVCQTLDMISHIVQKAPRCRNTKGTARLAEEAWPFVSQLFPPPPPAPLAPAGAPQSGQGQTGQNATSGASGSPDDSGQPPDQTGRDDNGQAGTIIGDPDEDNAPGGANTTAPAPNAPVGQAQAVAGQTSSRTNPPSGGSQTMSQSIDEDDGAADIMRALANSIVTMVNNHAQTCRAYRAWTTEFDTVMTARNRTNVPHHHRMAQLLPHVAGVRQKLLQTLLAEPKARWLGDREAGRINPHALYRLASPQSDSSGTGRVFRERVRTKRLHTAVTLLVDQSSSMSGEKIRLAGNTALVFCEALSRLDIPCNVVGFSTGEWDYYTDETEAKTGMTFHQLRESYRIAPLRHTYFKHFHESFRSVSGRFDAMHALCVTPLGESILFAARELAGRREERKVLLVITDGRPEVGMGNDAPTFEHAKRSIKRVERAGIDLALIGIMENCVNDLHHRAVVVNSLDELPKTVMRQLQSLLTEHHHIN